MYDAIGTLADAVGGELNQVGRMQFDDFDSLNLCTYFSSLIVLV